MTVRWERGSPEQFMSSPVRAVERVTDRFDMDALVSDAAGLMKDLIATRGTGRTWSRPGPSGRTGSMPGRIDSGNMWDSVTHRVSIQDDKIVGEFGWLNNQEPYFLFQEEGFTHWLTGQAVPAMLALKDAGAQAEQEFIRRLSQAVKSG